MEGGKKRCELNQYQVGEGGGGGGEGQQKGEVQAKIQKSV